MVDDVVAIPVDRADRYRRQRFRNRQRERGCHRIARRIHYGGGHRVAAVRQCLCLRGRDVHHKVAADLGLGDEGTDDAALAVEDLDRDGASPSGLSTGDDKTRPGRAGVDDVLPGNRNVSLIHAADPYSRNSDRGGYRRRNRWGGKRYRLGRNRWGGKRYRLGRNRWGGKRYRLGRNR